MVSLEQKVKFILYAWSIGLTAWVIAACLGVADVDQLVGYIVTITTGLGTAAMFLFDPRPKAVESPSTPDEQVRLSQPSDKGV